MRMHWIVFGFTLWGCQSPDEEPDPQPLTWHEPCPAESMETRQIAVGELSLHVACRGSGPTVVFLHGFPEFHYSWNKVMDELAGEFRLIAPDQRGYNLSDKPQDVEAYALPHLTADILSLLPILSPEPVILVAHDWGGPVGWMVAHTPDAHIRAFMSTNGPHPIRFVELLTYDDDQKAASGYMDFFRQEGAEALLTPEFFATDFQTFLSEEELAIYMDAWAQPGAITGGLNWYRANLLTEDSVAELMAERSPTVNVPVSVLWGEDDEAVLVSNAAELQPFAPDLTVDLFPGVDHWIEHRIPGEIADAIRTLHDRAPLDSP